MAKESSPEPESETDDENDTEEKKAERAVKRIKVMAGKLSKLKDKQRTFKKERMNLKDNIKKNQQTMKYIIQSLTPPIIIHRYVH